MTPRHAGPYRLLAPLQRAQAVGGSDSSALSAASVWSAIGVDGQRVVIKLGPIALPGQDPHLTLAAQRFERELRLTQDLHHPIPHPGLVALIDHGVCEPSTPGAPSTSDLPAPPRRWAAYEFIDGQDLSHHSSPATLLPWPTVLSLVSRVAEALAHAHRRGVLHRDVKPANIVWSPGGDRVVLLDWGMALEHALAQEHTGALDPGSDSSSAGSRTATGILGGSMGYVAPEILAGAPADVRSEIFALGVCLHELLCGTRPWAADSLGALFRAMATQDAQPVSAQRPADQPPLPAGIEQLVGACLQRAPSARPRHAAALASSLRLWQGTL